MDCKEGSGGSQGTPPLCSRSAQIQHLEEDALRGIEHSCSP